MTKNRIILWSAFAVCVVIIAVMILMSVNYDDNNNWWPLLSGLLLALSGVLWFNARKIQDYKARVRDEQQRAAWPPPR